MGLVRFLGKSRKVRLLAVLCAAVGLISAFLVNSPTEENLVCTECNLIIITADALRADHMSTYGYYRKTTPNLDAFAEKSVIFTNVVTPNPRTTPSLATMLTGLHPSETGVRNVYYKLRDSEFETLPEILRGYGINTGAIVSNWVLKPEFSNLQQGFDSYDYNVTEPELNRDEILERSAEQTTNEAISWLENRSNKPFFLWVHYIEPHGPYHPPKKFRSSFKHDGEKMVSVNLLPDYQILPEIDVIDGQTDILSYIDAYDDEILYLDNEVSRLLEHLDRTGLFKNTIVIFSADHGESLGEHSVYLEHGTELFENSAHIPLIIHFPSSFKLSPHQIPHLVSIADIFPSSLELLGIPFDPNKLPSYSIVPLLKGEDSSRRSVFIELFRKKTFQQLAVRTNSAKLIRYEEPTGIEFECYDLAQDPQEYDPEGCSAKTKISLEDYTESFLNSASTSTQESEIGEPKSEKDIRALKSLGYL